jgi:adenylylsulfate kinase
VRTGLNRNLGFADDDRTENIRRVAEVAKLFVQAGVVTLCSFITPLRSHRLLAREILGTADFLEVFVHASFDVCAQRDPKGLYAKARAGGVAQFTGRDSTFEEPAAGDGAFILTTEGETPEASLERLYAFAAPHLQFP